MRLVKFKNYLQKTTSFRTFQMDFNASFTVSDFCSVCDFSWKNRCDWRKVSLIQWVLYPFCHSDFMENHSGSCWLPNLLLCITSWFHVTLYRQVWCSDTPSSLPPFILCQPHLMSHTLEGGFCNTMEGIE